MQSGTRRTVAVMAAVALTAGLAWAAQGRSLEVTVNYAGAGDVSEDNAVYLSVWDNPAMQDIDANLLASAVVVENGGTASFSNLGASPVYVSALYDSTGGWDGLSEVPSGSPAGSYIAPGAFVPAPVELSDGETVELEWSFNDAFRLP